MKYEHRIHRSKKGKNKSRDDRSKIFKLKKEKLKLKDLEDG